MAPALVELGGSEQVHHEVGRILGAKVMVMDLGEAGRAFLSTEGDCRPLIHVPALWSWLGGGRSVSVNKYKVCVSK